MSKGERFLGFLDPSRLGSYCGLACVYIFGVSVYFYFNLHSKRVRLYLFVCMHPCIHACVCVGVCLCLCVRVGVYI